MRSLLPSRSARIGKDELSVARQLQAHVDPLSHRHRKPPTPDRLDRLTVDRDQFAFKLAKVDRERRRRGTIDDPHPHTSAPFDRNDLGVVQGPVIGQIGVIVDVVDIHRHAAIFRSLPWRRSSAPDISMPPIGMEPPLFMLCRPGQQLLRRREREIVEQDDNLLLVLCVIGGIGDNERSGKQRLLLQAYARASRKCRARRPENRNCDRL